MTKRSLEKFKVYKNVFDEFTLLTLHRLSSQGHFDELLGPVRIGKESNIFLAATQEDVVIVKIYRLSSCNFNQMYAYIRSDPRFMDLKGQRRQVIFKWVQREFSNLLIARQKVRVPKPIAFRNNVLVMESIGGRTPAPQLKDAEIADHNALMQEIVTQMTLLHETGLVHADLSSFNILLHRGLPYFIDFSQGTSIKDPQAEVYLQRDLHNIDVFFKKHGISMDISSVLKSIRNH